MQARPYLISASLRREDLPGVPPLDESVYPFSLPLVQKLTTLAFHPDVTFLIGENGTGKSTLVEALAEACRFGAQGGTRNVRLPDARTTPSLAARLKLVRSYKSPRDYYFLRAESFFNVATYMDEADYLAGYGGFSLHDRSHGEAFMTVLTQKMKGNGLYLLDEPEAALSPTRQMAALAAIHELVLRDSQFIIATHSPILMAYPRARILMLDGDTLHEVRYEETEHYRVTRDFFDHRRSVLAVLMGEDATGRNDVDEPHI